MTDTLIKERPMDFSGPMIRALLEDRKTQFRRVVNPQPSIEFNRDPPVFNKRYQVWVHPCACDEDIQDGTEWFRCPSGVPGDRLWVRETFNYDWPDGYEPIVEPGHKIYYKESDWIPDSKWLSPITMPRWASRIDLLIKDISVERLQDIKNSDVHAEGIVPEMLGLTPSFVADWDSRNAKKGNAWDTNPWVWVREIERIKP